MDQATWSMAIAAMASLVFIRYKPRKALHHALLLIVSPAVLCYFVSGSFSTVLSVYLSTVVACLAFYRAGPFHPLAAYPGPFLSRLLSLHMAWYAGQGVRHHRIAALHAKYGTHVRIAPNMLSIAHVDVVGTVFGPARWMRTISEPSHEVNLS